MGLNSKAVTNVKRQLDTLSDGHQDIVVQAVKATTAIIKLDERLESKCNTRMHGRLATQDLDELLNLLSAQATRALRVCSEIKQIKRTLRVD
jgi:hypothetical protein